MSDLASVSVCFDSTALLFAIVEETFVIHKAYLCSAPVAAQVCWEIRDKRIAQNSLLATPESFSVSSAMPKPLQSYELSIVFTMTNHIWREWSLAQNDHQTM